jgi:hypothetical protein
LELDLKESEMTPNPPAAFGLYPSTRSLHVGAEALRAASFRQTDISVLYSDGLQAFRLRESMEESAVAHEETESLGRMLSVLSGIGALDMRSDGPFMVAGPILATLAGVGELHASLCGLGIPESVVERFEGSLKQGQLLLSVQCDDTHCAERAERILQETGAEHVASSDKPDVLKARIEAERC